ncbi:type VI secretion system lipoprotein TssJ [Roseobacter sp.]|uniref:type VI secretion system lipoprotein TssJ n=1 Tax=Roseobacter sp. TaxID=1907202 RepID=UPI0032984F27
MIPRRQLILSTLALGALGACASQGPTPTDVALSITGAADMNGGAPAQVKIYYLADARVFRAADFFALFEVPETTLGDDLIATQTFGLAPGRIITNTQSFATTPPAAIGVVAAFRDIDGAFSATRTLMPNASNTVAITLTGNRVTIR